MSKKDQKARTDLLPARALLLVAETLTFGARPDKHGSQNPASVGESKLLASALRHILAMMDGQFLDSESELPHSAHAACNLLFIAQKHGERGTALSHCTKEIGGTDVTEAKNEKTRTAIQEMAESDCGQKIRQTKTGGVVDDVINERLRQLKLWGEQSHASGIHSTGWTNQREVEAKETFSDAYNVGAVTWKMILDEEIAELYNCVDPDHAYTEAIQVAAVALSMAESIKKHGMFGMGPTVDVQENA